MILINVLIFTLYINFVNSEVNPFFFLFNSHIDNNEAITKEIVDYLYKEYGKYFVNEEDRFKYNLLEAPAFQSNSIINQEESLLSQFDYTKKSAVCPRVTSSFIKEEKLEVKENYSFPEIKSDFFPSSTVIDISRRISYVDIYSLSGSFSFLKKVANFTIEMSSNSRYEISQYSLVGRKYNDLKLFFFQNDIKPGKYTIAIKYLQNSEKYEIILCNLEVISLSMNNSINNYEIKDNLIEFEPFNNSINYICIFLLNNTGTYSILKPFTDGITSTLKCNIPFSANKLFIYSIVMQDNGLMLYSYVKQILLKTPNKLNIELFDKTKKKYIHQQNNQELLIKDINQYSLFYSVKLNISNTCEPEQINYSNVIPRLQEKFDEFFNSYTLTSLEKSSYNKKIVVLSNKLKVNFELDVVDEKRPYFCLINNIYIVQGFRKTENGKVILACSLEKFISYIISSEHNTICIYHDSKIIVPGIINRLHCKVFSILQLKDMTDVTQDYDQANNRIIIKSNDFLRKIMSSFQDIILTISSLNQYSCPLQCTGNLCICEMKTEIQYDKLNYIFNTILSMNQLQEKNSQLNSQSFPLSKIAILPFIDYEIKPQFEKCVITEINYQTIDLVSTSGVFHDNIKNSGCLISTDSASHLFTVEYINEKTLRCIINNKIYPYLVHSKSFEFYYVYHYNKRENKYDSVLPPNNIDKIKLCTLPFFDKDKDIFLDYSLSSFEIPAFNTGDIIHLNNQINFLLLVNKRINYYCNLQNDIIECDYSKNKIAIYSDFKGEILIPALNFKYINEYNIKIIAPLCLFIDEFNYVVYNSFITQKKKFYIRKEKSIEALFTYKNTAKLFVYTINQLAYDLHFDGTNYYFEVDNDDVLNIFLQGEINKEYPYYIFYKTFDDFDRITKCSSITAINLEQMTLENISKIKKFSSKNKNIQITVNLNQIYIPKESIYIFSLTNVDNDYSYKTSFYQCTFNGNHDYTCDILFHIGNDVRFIHGNYCIGIGVFNEKEIMKKFCSDESNIKIILSSEDKKEILSGQIISISPNPAFIDSKITITYVIDDNKSPFLILPENLILQRDESGSFLIPTVDPGYHYITIVDNEKTKNQISNSYPIVIAKKSDIVKAEFINPYYTLKITLDQPFIDDSYISSVSCRIVSYQTSPTLQTPLYSLSKGMMISSKEILCNGDFNHLIGTSLCVQISINDFNQYISSCESQITFNIKRDIIIVDYQPKSIYKVNEKNLFIQFTTTEIKGVADIKCLIETKNQVYSLTSARDITQKGFICDVSPEILITEEYFDVIIVVEGVINKTTKKRIPILPSFTIIDVEPTECKYIF